MSILAAHQPFNILDLYFYTSYAAYYFLILLFK